MLTGDQRKKRHEVAIKVDDVGAEMVSLRITTNADSGALAEEKGAARVDVSKGHSVVVAIEEDGDT